MEKIRPAFGAKEGFWDEIQQKNPEAFEYFSKWIDAYKQEIGWEKVFGGVLKFHDLPIEMQFGIIDRFVSEVRNGIYTADKIQSRLPGTVALVFKEVQVYLVNSGQKASSKNSIYASVALEGEWISVGDELPAQGQVVMTKIDENGRVLMEQMLKLHGSLWYVPDGSVRAYYRPTHWKPAKQE